MNIRSDIPSLAQLEYEIGWRLRQGDMNGAAHAAALCCRVWPSSISGWHYGSIVALMAGDRMRALAIIEEGLSRHPTSVQCLLQRAEVLLSIGRREEALGAAAAASANAGNLVQALEAIGDFLVHAKEHGTALSALDRAIAAAPSDANLWLKRASVHRYLGQFDLADSDCQAVLRIDPTEAQALKIRSELTRQRPDHHQIPAMEAALARAPEGSDDAVTLRFALAKSCEDLGLHARSWEHLTEGNRIRQRELPYDSALDEAAIQRLLASFGATESPWPDSTGEAPIFIVGLPRSGTTLAERVIGNHSQVHAAGELSAWLESLSAVMGSTATSQAADWSGFAGALGGLEPAEVAREYLARVKAWRGLRPRFCDKQTMNFFHCAR